MKKYYISLRSFSNGQHIVHLHDCPFILENNQHILLGEFATPDEAILEGRKLFRYPEFCRFCLIKRKLSIQNMTAEIASGTKLIKSKHLKPLVKNNMLVSNC